MQRILPIILCAIILGCSSEQKPIAERAPNVSAVPAPKEALVHTYSVVRTLPHDSKAYTQGLNFYRGVFIESTGQFGQSTIRSVVPGTGTVQRKESLEDKYFGEGCTILNGKGYLVTWLNQTGFVFDPITLRRSKQFAYSGEGWGLTNDGANLIMSNGTSTITFHEPDTYRVTRSIQVTLNGSPVMNLNELEWIEGEIWANIWQTDRVVRINPADGIVNGVIDFTGLLSEQDRTPSTDVLNGIAYDSASKAIYVTGKNWPHVFEVKVR